MTKNLRSIEASEHQIQAAIVERVNLIFLDHIFGSPEIKRKVCLGDYLIKIPNEGKRSWLQGKKMKKEGMKAGASDLFLSFPTIRHHGFWLEIKKKGKEPTDEQLEFLAAMRAVGYRADWTDDVDEGVIMLKNYVGMK